MASISEKISVEIIWGRAAQTQLEREGEAQVSQEIEGYVNGLAADLGLPTEVAVVFTTKPDDEGLYRIRVNSEPARIPVKTGTSIAENLAQIATNAIYLNRELLLDDGSIRTLRLTPASVKATMHLPGLTNGEYLDLHRMLVRAGLSVARGARLSEQDLIDEKRSLSAIDYFEKAVEGFLGLRVTIRHAPGRLSSLSPADGKPLSELLALMQDGLFYELGVRIPKPVVHMDDKVRSGEVVFQINDTRLPSIHELADSEFLASAPEQLGLLEVEWRAALNPANGNAAVIVKDDGLALEKCRQIPQLQIWGRDGYLVLALSKVLRRHAAAFVTQETVTYELDQLATAYPDLVDLARRQFTLDTMTEAIRRLAREEISFRDLRGVLEGMLAVRRVVDVDFGKFIVFLPYTMTAAAATFGAELDLVTATGYAEAVRASFKRYISHKYTRGAATLMVYLIDPGIEQRVSTIGAMDLNRAERAAIVDAIAAEYGRFPGTTDKPVLLTTLETRCRLRELIEVEMPDLPVVSYQELSPDMNIQPIARIALPAGL